MVTLLLFFTFFILRYRVFMLCLKFSILMFNEKSHKIHNLFFLKKQLLNFDLDSQLFRSHICNIVCMSVRKNHHSIQCSYHIFC